MKKIRWIALLGLTLSVALCVPAMAQTIGIAVDGKTYTFTGSEGTYEAEGKTFVIGVDTVTIKESGKPDRVLALSRSAEGSQVQVDAVFVESPVKTSVATDSEITEDAAADTICVEQTADTAACAIGSDSSTAMTEYSLFAYTLEDAKEDPTRFDEYAKLGLSFDAADNALFYQGRRVRIFEDSYELDDQSVTSLEHVDDQGTIDVRTIRDLTRKGRNADGSDDLTATLTGLYVLTDAEFAARRLSDWTQTEASETAVEGGEMSAAEREAFYAPYAAFGLRYNAATDTLTYRGQRVRSFTDIKQSNGESLESGRFHGVMSHIGSESGEIDVETIRDYTKPDANGDGTLMGFSVESVH